MKKCGSGWKRKVITIIVIMSLMSSMIIQKEPFEIKAANYVMEGNTTIVFDGERTKELYRAVLTPEGLEIRAQFFYNSSATLSYHTKYLYFTPVETGCDPLALGNRCKRITAIHTKTEYVGDRTYTTFFVPAATIESYAREFFGSEALKQPEGVTLYMSQGFVLKRRESAQDEWKIDRSPVYSSESDIQGAAAWTMETFYNFSGYYDVPIKVSASTFLCSVKSANEEWGITQSSAGTAKVGATVTAKAMANPGYVFSHWQLEEGWIEGISPEKEELTFSMPATDVVLVAHFKALPKLTPTKPPECTPTLKPGATASPTPSPKPTQAPSNTPTPKPFLPEDDSLVQKKHIRYFTTDEGYTMQEIYIENGMLADLTGESGEGRITECYYTKQDKRYSVGADEKGNQWYFYPSENEREAYYVHPYIYEGNNAGTEQIRNITELVFPETLYLNGEAYTVRGIGGGTSGYRSFDAGSRNNSEESWELTTARGQYSYWKTYTHSVANYMHQQNYYAGITYGYGVAGTGFITSKGDRNFYWYQNNTERYDSSEYQNDYYVHNTTLKYITIPACVTELAPYAFWGCQALEKITGGEGVLSIGKGAFEASDHLIPKLSISKNRNEFTFYYYNTSYSEEALTERMKHWKKEIPLSERLWLAPFEKLTRIYEEAFLWRSNLFDVEVPESVTEIRKNAFAGSRLNSITINSSATVIQDGANYGDKDGNYYTYGAAATLGTKGTKETVIYTVPETKAMRYGLLYRERYTVRCGYEVVYHKNAEPEETYSTVSKIQLVSAEIKESVTGELSTYTETGNYYLRGRYRAMIDVEGRLWFLWTGDLFPRECAIGEKFRHLETIRLTMDDRGNEVTTYCTFAYAESGKLYVFDGSTWNDMGIPAGSHSHQWIEVPVRQVEVTENSVYNNVTYRYRWDFYLYYITEAGQLGRRLIYSKEETESGDEAYRSYCFEKTVAAETIALPNGGDAASFSVAKPRTGESRDAYYEISGGYRTEQSYTLLLPDIYLTDTSGVCYKAGRTKTERREYRTVGIESSEYKTKGYSQEERKSGRLAASEYEWEVSEVSYAVTGKADSLESANPVEEFIDVGYEFAETIPDPSALFLVEGKVFQTWNTKKDGSGTVYKPGEELKLAEAIHLYAQWGEAIKIVRYAPNGGSGTMEDDSYSGVSVNAKLKENAFWRMGYTFAGWNTMPDGSGIRYEENETVALTNGMLVVYAQWKPRTYNVKVAEDEIQVTPVTIVDRYSLKHGEAMEIPGAREDKFYTVSYDLNWKESRSTVPYWKTEQPLGDNYTKAYLAFLGWQLYEEIDGAYVYVGFYRPGEVVCNFAVHSSELTLFPLWGGEAAYVDLPLAACEGYEFLGWTVNSNETKEEAVIPAEAGSGARYKPTGNITLYGFYLPREYKVVLDGRGATKQEQTYVMVLFDETMPEILVPEKTGYRFRGFTSELRGGGILYYDEKGVSEKKWQNPEVTVLYAYWELLPVDLPEWEDIPEPPKLPEERIVIRAGREDGSVHFVSGKYDVEAEGIPSTETVAIRAQTGSWLFSCELVRSSGVEWLPITVTVPYRTMYEEEETEEIIVSELRYAAKEISVPASWSYWRVDGGKMYYPKEAIVKNTALAEGQRIFSFSERPEVPTFELKQYTEAERMITKEIPSAIVLEEQFIISQHPGKEPEIEEYIAILCNNAAGKMSPVISVKSDFLTVGENLILSDRQNADGNGEAPSEEGIAGLLLMGENSQLLQETVAGAALEKTVANGVYETEATVIYEAKDRAIISKDISVTGEVIIHTPVVCKPVFEQECPDEYQGIRKQDEMDILVLGEEGDSSAFWLEIKNDGFHSEKKGYGEREYGAYVAVSDGKRRNEVWFPFEVWIDIGNDSDNTNDRVLPKNTWYGLGTEKQRFYVPFWVPEDTYEISFRTVAINGVGKESMAMQEKNTHREFYVATGKRRVRLVGSVSDFFVYDIKGSTEWEEMAPGDIYYTVEETENLKKSLPLRDGVHPRYRNLGALTPGTSVYFCVKTVGISYADAGYMNIIPRVWTVTSKGREPVDLYFEKETPQGIFLTKWEPQEQSIMLHASEHSKPNPGAEEWWTEYYGNEIEIEEAVRSWCGTFSLPNQYYASNCGFDVLEYQRTYGLDFSEDFWCRQETLLLTFEIQLHNSTEEVLYYGRIPSGPSNIWKKEAGSLPRTDTRGLSLLIQGGEVALLQSGKKQGNSGVIHGDY